uniref:GNAT family N-acetyltransferase n=1 Tax=Thaumasiovibrio occultus TaxID=1891184 RepID=UPI000B358242|nr:N-acetyltransferase [Thaumasiovibrio occultus]
MLIRTEAPADIMRIDRLLKQAFETDAEAQLVMTLRENSETTLSLVATDDDGEVMGHIFFSPVTVAGEERGWQGLGPLAVHPDHRQQGIAKALIAEGFEILAELGYPVVVVLGDPQNYRSSGFVTAAAHQLDCRWPVPEELFMVRELLPDSLCQLSGRVEYSAAFNEL